MIWTLAGVGLIVGGFGWMLEEAGVTNVIPDNPAPTAPAPPAPTSTGNTNNNSPSVNPPVNPPAPTIPPTAPNPNPGSTGNGPRGGDNVADTQNAADKERSRNFSGTTYGRTLDRRSTQKTTKDQVLRYPYEALTEQTDYLKINIVDYVSLARRYSGQNKLQNKEVDDTSRLTGLIRNFNAVNDRGRQITSNPESSTVNNNTKLSDRSLVRNGTIILPMPDNIADGNSVSYADSEMNALTAIALAGGYKFMTDVGDAVGRLESPSSIMGKAGAIAKQYAGQAYESVGQDAGLKDIITKKLSSMLVGAVGGNVTVNQLLARQDGVIFNPNKELLFNGVNLRTFNFSFKLMPRNKNESLQVERIIRSFKRNMAPVVGGSKTGYGFLRTPSIFELQYMSGSRQHPFLHKFKQCFLENCTVNYTGDGFYATYKDGEPVSMILNLTFKEIEPLYDIDYDTIEIGGVGY